MTFHLILSRSFSVAAAAGGAGPNSLDRTTILCLSFSSLKQWEGHTSRCAWLLGCNNTFRCLAICAVTFTKTDLCVICCHEVPSLLYGTKFLSYDILVSLSQYIKWYTMCCSSIQRFMNSGPTAGEEVGLLRVWNFYELVGAWLLAVTIRYCQQHSEALEILYFVSVTLNCNVIWRQVSLRSCTSSCLKDKKYLGDQEEVGGRTDALGGSIRPRLETHKLKVTKMNLF